MSSQSLLPFLEYLPELHFCETDPAAVEKGFFALYEKITGLTLAPGNPERLFIETVASIVAMQRVVIDESARSQLLAYAAGEHLDHLGAWVSTQRLAASPAKDVLRVELASVQGAAWTAPQGTRVTPNGTLLFATDSALVIPAGQTVGEVGITCLAEGAVGNGYLAGQIARLVDPLPFVASVANVGGTSGGADVEADDNFRERIQLAPAQYSVAGPDDAYVYWVRSAHQLIKDVAVVSPAPVEVELYPLLADGAVPEQSMLDLVSATVLQKSRVPLTDRVSVKAPVVVEYPIEITWWLEARQSASLAPIATAVNAAVAAFAAWQRAKLGRDITPSELIRQVQSAGVKRVVATSPADTPLHPWEVAHASGIIVTFGGLE
ncbi:Phage-related baseplate assembly protein [Humidesulfovibrio mexicanus]|uniref:Phage-related baseplate assembly protein n=1 Tax=Humidesulfovibrio mexicanus TaxID=147047 RepID=A0A239CA17_9BACT|nr:baseplate J/gp47 family protein [Humidesulfovibrio mexicanus]SNS16183.1 Phage-related baseplate assembly protein [Humidesulfovibrio mexicanus]